MFIIPVIRTKNLVTIRRLFEYASYTKFRRAGRILKILGRTKAQGPFFLTVGTLYLFANACFMNLNMGVLCILPCLEFYMCHLISQYRHSKAGNKRVYFSYSSSLSFSNESGLIFISTNFKDRLCLKRAHPTPLYAFVLPKYCPFKFDM